MTDKPLPRPRQVSFSGWTIIVGSVLTILFAFQRVAALGSLEAQQAATDFVATSPGSGLGLSVEDVQTAIRIMCLVAGGTAAATAILGWHVMRPSRSARVVLSVLAPVLFVSGLTSGGLLSALVAAGTAMLWAQPARDWFNGKAPAPVADKPARGAGRSADHAAAKAGVAASAPPPQAPTGSAWDLPAPGAYAAPTSSPYGAPGATYPAPSAERGPRPGRVTAAVVTTIVASAITFAGLVVSILFVLASREDFLTEIESQLATNSAYAELSAEAVADVAVGFLAVLAVWCLAAIVLAVLTLRGSNAARITLVVSAVLSALVSLLGLLVVVPLLLTAASIATATLLLTGGVGDWFSASGRPQRADRSPR